MKIKSKTILIPLFVVVFILVGIIVKPFISRAGDTGLLSPTATGEDYNQWTSPTSAFSSNETPAIEITFNQRQDYYNFSFSIPVGATIDGIEVRAEAKDVDCTNCIMGVELSWDGGSSYTTAGYDTGELTTSYVIYTLGGATDQWDERTWVDTEFSNANFRLRVSAFSLNGGEFPAIHLDHVQAKVYYTEGGSSGSSKTEDVKIRGGVKVRGGVEFR